MYAASDPVNFKDPTGTGPILGLVIGIGCDLYSAYQTAQQLLKVGQLLEQVAQLQSYILMN